MGGLIFFGGHQVVYLIASETFHAHLDALKEGVFMKRVESELVVPSKAFDVVTKATDYCQELNLSKTIYNLDGDGNPSFFKRAERIEGVYFMDVCWPDTNTVFHKGDAVSYTSSGTPCKMNRYWTRNLQTGKVLRWSNMDQCFFLSSTGYTSCMSNCGTSGGFFTVDD